jgi:hypothetical protein
LLLNLRQISNALFWIRSSSKDKNNFWSKSILWKHHNKQERIRGLIISNSKKSLIKRSSENRIYKYLFWNKSFLLLNKKILKFQMSFSSYVIWKMSFNKIFYFSIKSLKTNVKLWKNEQSWLLMKDTNLSMNQLNAILILNLHASSWINPLLLIKL